eukprot:2194619-Rhodomonas_salina.1
MPGMNPAYRAPVATRCLVLRYGSGLLSGGTRAPYPHRKALRRPEGVLHAPVHPFACSPENLTFLSFFFLVAAYGIGLRARYGAL